MSSAGPVTPRCLREQADRDLSESGGIPSLLIYPVLVVSTALASDLWNHNSVLVFSTCLLTILIGAIRCYWGQQLKLCEAQQLPKVKWIYSLCVVAVAVVWSTYAATIVHLYGRSWTGLLALLITLGIVAASTANLTSNFALMRIYILLMIVPAALTMGLHGHSSELLTSAMLMAFGYFMVAIGQRHCLRYDNLSQALLDLENSQHQWQSMAAELRRLAAGQQAAIEEERLRLAREVHDELGQLLTALRLDLSWLERRLQSPELLERASSMNELIQATITSVRRISSSLRPPLLDELGLGPALDWLVQDIASRSHLTHHLKLQLGSQPLGSELSLAVFRICQEALTNVVRHAKASRVEVEVMVREQRIHLQVRDDGVGIAPERLHASLGLLGLQERVQILGGNLSVTGRPGQGTTITASIPVGRT